MYFHTISRFTSGLVSLFLFPLVVGAAEPDTSTSTTGAAPSAPMMEGSGGVESETWAPSIPSPVDFDWIQLSSGEWLKGELKVLYDNELEFDSDELDLLKFDWEDINQVLGHGLHTANIEGQGPVVGQLRIIGDRVTVVTSEGEKQFARADLVSIAAGQQRESDYWSSKITLGLNIRSGNTEQVEYNAKASAKRRTAESRFTADYLGNYTKTDSLETSNNHRLSASYDVFRARSYYWRPVFGEYFRDPFQNIAHKVTVGTGFGYHFIDTAKTTWDINPGVGYQYVEYDTVEAGKASTNNTPVLVVATDYDTEINSKMDFIATYQILWGESESGGYTHHTVVTLENEITGALDFDVSFVWDYVQHPTTESGGRVPERNDYRIMVGLGFDY